MMTKFRSLLYREMRICRKGNILRAGLLVLFVGMMWVMLFSVPFDHLEGAEAITNAHDFLVNTAILYTALIGVMVGLGQDEVFKSDLNAGWLTYSYGLPITPFDRALVRIVRLSILTAAGMVAAVLNIIGFCAFMDVPFRISYITLLFLALDFMLVPTIINEFFALAARSMDELKKYAERAGWVTLGLMALTGVIIIIKSGFGIKDFTAVYFEEHFSEGFDIFEKLTPTMLFWLIPLTLALIAIHFAVVYYRFRFAYGTAAGTKKAKTKKIENTALISRAHNEPTGLLYKEIKQNRYHILLAAILPMGLMLFAVLVVAFAFAFNRENFEASYQEVITGKLMTFITLAIGYFIASGVLTSIFIGDDKKLWAYFIVAMPKGIKGFLYYKYVLCFAMNGLYMVAWIFTNSIMNTLQYALLGTEAESMNNIVLAIFFALLFFTAIDIPFMIRFGAKKGNTIKLWVMMALVSVAVVGFALLPASISDMIMEVFIKLFHGEANGTLMLLVSVCPIIVLAAYMLSYKISCRLFMKGVAAYDK